MLAGGSDLGLFEVSEAADVITKAAHPEANIIFGSVIDDSLGDEVKVTVIAAGFDKWAQPMEQEGAIVAGPAPASPPPEAPTEPERPRLQAVQDDGFDDVFRSEPPAAPPAADDDDLDIPSFLR